ncbi:multidrug ABC transporter permease [Streptomyces antioxidans]|uniref:Multidrug ABC transporter permease n=1 Tax=Streptomyces antioxidans TaxID=1507734 RepID=A0A1V4D4K5_9ACTN|nr:ABC transporter ATP-binding protein [Streptomyces antioxidans]OPF79079.1 multidrug ABC transporter permease [Streptomyces antioxidans]
MRGRKRYDRETVRQNLSRFAAACSLAFTSAKWPLIAYAAQALVTGVLPVLTAWLTKVMLDRLTQKADIADIVAVAAALAVAGIAVGAAQHISTYLREEIKRRIGIHSQARLFGTLNTFVGIGRFEDPDFLDRLRLAQRSGGPAPGFLVEASLNSMRSGTVVIGFLSSLFVISPLMAAFMVVFGVIILISEISISRRRARMIRTITPAERREFFYGELLSQVEAAKEVRLFGIGDFLQGRMLSERRFANEATKAVERREMRVQTLLSVLAALASGCGILWVAYASRSGEISVGDIALFIAATAGVQAALAQLSTEVARVHHSLLLFGHYQAIIGAGPDLPVSETPERIHTLRQGIELRDVWFRYADDQAWVLKGVNLFIPRGQSLALVGLNGAGKSTLVKLLCRLYDPTKGAVLWDGVDIRTADPRELRARISAIFQDFMSYEMTAHENIGMGEMGSFDDGERIRAAARLSGMHDAITKLPDGYDTMLTRTFFSGSLDDAEQGVQLSGGQWQRVALARGFMRSQSDLMILDEPSAGLDAEAEYEIHNALRRHRRDSTSVLISHRLAAVRSADHIAVLSEGRILENGSHAALMAAGGEYARLFTIQASGYQDAAGEPEERVPSAVPQEAL